MEAPPVEKEQEKSVQNNSFRRKLLQVQYEEEYLQALISIKEKYFFSNYRIMRVEGPDMKEAMQDDFRQWYMEHKRAHGVFPEFPSEEVWQQSGFKFSQAEAIAQTLLEAATSKEEKPETPSKKTPDKKEKKGAKEDEIVEDPSTKLTFDDSIYLEAMKKEY